MFGKRFLVIVLVLAFTFSASTGLNAELKFKFEGWKNITPTDVCSLIDMVIVMQNAHKKLDDGVEPSTIALFDGKVPPPDLVSVDGSPKPKRVAQTLVEALNVFNRKTGFDVDIPDLPDRKIYPADVLVYSSLAFDSLGAYLQREGVRQVGDFSLLRYRYTTRLRPKDCLRRASLVLENWKAIKGI